MKAIILIIGVLHLTNIPYGGTVNYRGDQMKKELPIPLEDTTPAYAIRKKQQDKDKIVNRLKRIEGQVRGIEKMIEQDRYCIDVLIQISAVNAALKKVGYTVMEQHTRGCVAEAIKSGDGDEALDELMKVIQQFSKS